MTSPLISVLMPAYNVEKYISKAISSILNQDYKNIELLIINDGSTDNTCKIIKSFKDNRIKFFQNEVNLGYLNSCNILFNQCNGNYITFQDADDFSDIIRLSKQLNEFLKRPKLGICGTYAEYINENEEFVRLSKTYTKSLNIKKHITNRNQYCGATIMVPKHVLDSIGGYRIYFDRIGSEDYDWALRISENYLCSNVPEPLYKVRITPNSLSRNINDFRKLYSGEIAKLLAKERLINGTDSLMNGNYKYLKDIEQSMAIPYLSDSSLIYRKSAELCMYNQLYKTAIKNCIYAIRTSPNKFINYRILAYCFRKANIKLLS